jgi:hypothetical protein
LNLQLEWLAPFDLIDGSRSNLIYDIEHLDQIPEKAGVYVFARVHGKAVAPLYIGRAENLQRRIGQQLNNVRLMRGIENAQAGYRTLHVARFIARPSQYAPRMIKTIEAALISTALVEGFELLNISGTKTLIHTITSSGNREARRWLPENTIGLRRGA